MKSQLNDRVTLLEIPHRVGIVTGVRVLRGECLVAWSGNFLRWHPEEGTGDRLGISGEDARGEQMKPRIGAHVVRADADESMNYEEWRATQRKALEVINEFSAMGIPVPTGPGTPRQMSSLEVLAYQAARAFDHAIEDDDDGDQGFGFRGRCSADDEDTAVGFDAELRQAAHKVLNRCIDTVRRARRERRRLTDEERMDLRVAKSLLSSPGSIAPWNRLASGRAADAGLDVDDDIARIQRAALESCGCI